MSELEKNIQQEIRLAAKDEGCTLFRANAGMAWQGNKTQRMKDGSLVIHDPRPFHGMIEGFPDLVGWQTITITQDMVGKKMARIVLPEVKQKRGKARDAQVRFKAKADKDHAVCGLVRSVEDFKNLVKI